MLHKRCVQEIIVTATAEKRAPLLAVLNDELARSSCVCFVRFACAACVPVLRRKDREDKSAKLGKRFDISMHAGKLSEETLRRARALYGLLFAASGATQRPKSPVRTGSTACTVMSYAKVQPHQKGMVSARRCCVAVPYWYCDHAACLLHRRLQAAAATSGRPMAEATSGRPMLRRRARTRKAILVRIS